MKLCKDCEYSELKLYIPRCNNPEVNKRNSEFLATGVGGVYCSTERSKLFIHIPSRSIFGSEEPLVYISACGRRGAQFKPILQTPKPDYDFEILSCK